MYAAKLSHVGDKLQQHIVATNHFVCAIKLQVTYAHRDYYISEFVTATDRPKSEQFEFVRHAAAEGKNVVELGN